MYDDDDDDGQAHTDFIIRDEWMVKIWVIIWVAMASSGLYCNVVMALSDSYGNGGTIRFMPQWRYARRLALF